MLIYLQVIHPDFKMISKGSISIEPIAGSDFLLYEPLSDLPKSVTVSLDPATLRWNVAGLAEPALYSRIFQVLPSVWQPCTDCIRSPFCTCVKAVGSCSGFPIQE